MNILTSSISDTCKRGTGPEAESNLQAPNGHKKSHYCGDRAGSSIRSTISLPREILESAYFLFNKKGFEKTTVPDICLRLGIKPYQFYNHFDSLDEVLEILWAR